MAFAILVQGVAKSEHAARVKEAMMTLAAESMKQPVTIRYEFYQSQDNPLNCVLFAMWDNEAGWKASVESAAHDRYMQSLPKDSWETRSVLTKLEPMGK